MVLQDLKAGPQLMNLLDVHKASTEATSAILLALEAMSIFTETRQELAGFEEPMPFFMHGK